MVNVFDGRFPPAEGGWKSRHIEREGGFDGQRGRSGSSSCAFKTAKPWMCDRLAGWQAPLGT